MRDLWLFVLLWSVILSALGFSAHKQRGSSGAVLSVTHICGTIEDNNLVANNAMPYMCQHNMVDPNQIYEPEKCVFATNLDLVGVSVVVKEDVTDASEVGDVIYTIDGTKESSMSISFGTGNNTTNSCTVSSASYDGVLDEQGESCYRALTGVTLSAGQELQMVVAQELGADPTTLLKIETLQVCIYWKLSSETI